jgi:SM-20-related protein
LATPDSWKVLNADALRKAALVTEPFPYLVIDNLIRPEALAGVVESFPVVPKRGSVPLDTVSYSGAFATLMEEMHSTELRDLIGERLGMDLSDKPPMITVRGRTDTKDGDIHTDSKSKLVTLLLYLNPGWQAPGGRLRLLYNDKDLDRYAAEISPEAGRSVIFKVTPNCWHGHEHFIGERRSVQLNYVTSDEARQGHLKRHRFSVFLKKLFSREDEKSTAH